MESLSVHNMTLKQVVEALVFASPKPLTIKEIITALKGAGNPEKTDDASALEYAKAKEPDVEAVLAEIAQELVDTGRSFQLAEQISGWSLVTDPKAVHWVRQLYPEAKPTRLSGPQLETLAIIAYRQPVTRADIEAVRGVAVDGPVQVLMERSLIKIAGRAELPGRPLLYSTTEYFLQHFGLKKVDELPNAQELRKMDLPKAEIPPEPAPEGEGAPTEEKPKKGKKKKDAAATEAAVDGAAAVPAEAVVEGAAVAAGAATEAAVETAADAAETAGETEHAEAEAAPVDLQEREAEGEGESAPEPEVSIETETFIEPELTSEPEPEPEHKNFERDEEGEGEGEPAIEMEAAAEPEPIPEPEPAAAEEPPTEPHHHTPEA